MFCSLMEKNISALADGELKGIKKAAAEAHIAACADCRAKYSFLESIAAAASLPPAGLPPADLEAKIMAKIGTAGRTALGKIEPRSPVFGIRLAAAAAVLLLLLAAGIMLSYPRPGASLPEATISRQTGAGTAEGGLIPGNSGIAFATFANQTGR